MAGIGSPDIHSSPIVISFLSSQDLHSVYSSPPRINRPHHLCPLTSPCAPYDSGLVQRNTMDEVLPEEVRELEWKDLPVEIIDLIVTYCSAPTVLRLRVVSKTLKEIVDASPRFKEVVGEVCVDLGPETLRTFVMEAPDFPFQDFYFSTDDFCDDVDDFDFMREDAAPPLWEMDSELVNLFIQRFSSKIRKLQVTRMFCGTADNELKFFESLVNLRVLEVDWLEPVTDLRPQILPKLGPVGLSMKVLNVKNEMNTGDYLIDWIKKCPVLEEIAVPDERGERAVGAEMYGRVARQPHFRYPYILRLGAEGRLPKLRILDLSSEPIDLRLCTEPDKRFFYKVLTQREGFRVRNVKAEMLEEVRSTCVSPAWDWRTMDAFKRTVESLYGMHEMLQEEGFETLEDLTFFPAHNVLESGEVRPLRIPGLRKVALKLYTRNSDVALGQRFLDRLCLPEEPRWSVKHLSLSFEFFSEGITLPPEYLNQSFPNLQRVFLDLDGFSREQKVEVIEIMSRKPFLEEMILLSRSCGTPEEAFFGGVEPPVLLQFPKLKELSLYSGDLAGREVEVMTDRSLQLFGRMALSHLSIYGPGWESVTNEGVRKLLGGTLGRTVLSVELKALEVEGDEERRKLLDDVKEVARMNKATLT